MEIVEVPTNKHVQKTMLLQFLQDPVLKNMW